MSNANAQDSIVLRGHIENWLARTRDVEILIGCDEERVAVKARELRDAILKGGIAPETLTVDEDLKEALSALVFLLAKAGGTGGEKLAQANAIYQFIYRLSWTADPLDEKRDLLLECADIGWGAIGLSVADVTRQRLAGDVREVPQSKTDPDPVWMLLSVVSRLKTHREVSPTTVRKAAEALYCRVISSSRSFGLFDDREYCLGETALLAGHTSRLLGRRDESELWLDRADACFRHIVNATPLLANVSYARLALCYDRGQYDRILEHLPSLTWSYEKLGMRSELLKCRFLEALTLKAAGRGADARICLDKLSLEADLGQEPVLAARVLVTFGEELSAEGNHRQALASFRRALPLASEQPISTAYLKCAIGESLRNQGLLQDSVQAYGEAIRAYSALEMQSWVSYIRVIVSEVLIALNRNREAESEILAALPTIEEQRMVPEGFAAVALLKESVRRRKTDPNALRELREHLKANK